VTAVVVNEEDFNDCDKDKATLTLRRRTVIARRPMYFAAAKASLRSISRLDQSVPPGPFSGMAGDRLRAQQHNRKRQRGRARAP
jgi:hypothetical protein